MAENKKSFIIYSDSKSLVDKLPNKTAGELFKMLFAYVNDENPTTEDILLEIAFEHFKQKLKQDLVKWDETKKKRSEAGKKGMAARWNNNKTITKDNNVIKPITKITVNDNVNVSVNVNDINKRKADFKKSLLPFLDIYDKELLNDFFEYWTEHGEKDRKFRKEKEKSFNIELRLKTWFKRSKQWKKEKNFAPKKEKVSAAQIIQQVKDGTYGSSN